MTGVYVYYTYENYNYCQHGCGEHKGWFMHGTEAHDKNGNPICPECSCRMRTRSRHGYGIYRRKEPKRI